MLSLTVIIETTENEITKTQNFEVENVGPKTVIRHFLFAINQKSGKGTVTLYHDCIKKGTIHIPSSFREMVDDVRNPQIQVVSFC